MPQSLEKILLRQSFALLLLVGVAFAVHGCATVANSGSAPPQAPAPSQVEPVTAAMEFDRPIAVPGQALDLLVQVRIAGGHHIYGIKPMPGPFLPTALSLDLPVELEPVGAWAVPRPIIKKGGERIYRDSILFRHRVRVSLNAPAKQVSIKGELQFQACNEELCRPPEKIALSASFAVVAK